MPTVVHGDPERLLTDYLFTLLPTLPIAAGYTVGTQLSPGVTPTHAVRVRLIGGTDEGRTHSRPRLDIRVWADGTSATEAEAKALARTLHGHIVNDFRCATFAVPVPLPDPANPARTHVLFSVELLTKGIQS